MRNGIVALITVISPFVCLAKAYYGTFRFLLMLSLNPYDHFSGIVLHESHKSHRIPSTASSSNRVKRTTTIRRMTVSPMRKE
jgi:hypothetical protein